MKLDLGKRHWAFYVVVRMCLCSLCLGESENDSVHVIQKIVNLTKYEASISITSEPSEIISMSISEGKVASVKKSQNEAAFVEKAASISITPEPSEVPSITPAPTAVKGVCPLTFLERLGDAARRRRHLWRNIETQTVLMAKPHAQSITDLSVPNDPVSTPSRAMDMAGLSWSMGISFMAGLSTVIGAAFIFALPGNAVSPSQMAFALSLAGGVMISVTVLEFWLPVLSSKDDDGDSLARMIHYSALGLGAFLVLSRLIPHSTSFFGTPDIEGGECGRYLSTEPTEHIHADHDGIEGVATSTRSWRLAIVLVCSLTAHNFPEGFAVAVSSLSSGSPSYVIPLAIAVHNVPEGIAIAVPVMAASGSRMKALKFAFLSGMAEPLGAAMAILCMNVTGAVASEDSVNNLLCVVGGIMTSVAIFELLPDAWQYGQPVACYVGFLVGCVVMLTSLSLGA